MIFPSSTHLHKLSWYHALQTNSKKKKYKKSNILGYFWNLFSSHDLFVSPCKFNTVLIIISWNQLAQVFWIWQNNFTVKNICLVSSSMKSENRQNSVVLGIRSGFLEVLGAGINCNGHKGNCGGNTSALHLFMGACF